MDNCLKTINFWTFGKMDHPNVCMGTSKKEKPPYSHRLPPWGVPKVEMMVVGRGVNIHQWYVIGLCAVHTLEVLVMGCRTLF